MAIVFNIFTEFNALTIGIISVLIFAAHCLRRLSGRAPIPVSVNYHFTRKCNYSCEFCFHTSKTSHIESLPSAKRGLALLKRAGMRKINFAGGEPFLYKPLLAELLRYCKETLHLESVSIVSNGSKIDETFLQKHGRYIDILAVSCDSFDDMTNKVIGRTDGTAPIQVARLYRVAAWCRNYNVKFKLNTVICTYNVAEDMAAAVTRLAPFRWKVFQVLMVTGENDSDRTKRDTRGLLISDEAFEGFCRRHCHLDCFVPESNRLMRNSYLILDEYMCFLDKEKGTKSRSILDVGVEEALKQVKWDEKEFVERGGLYDWTKETYEEIGLGCQNERAKDLEF